MATIMNPSQRARCIATTFGWVISLGRLKYTVERVPSALESAGKIRSTVERKGSNHQELHRVGVISNQTAESEKCNVPFAKGGFFFAMDLIVTILPVVTKDLPISPRFTPYNFLSRCKFSKHSYNSSTNG